MERKTRTLLEEWEGWKRAYEVRNFEALQQLEKCKAERQIRCDELGNEILKLRSEFCAISLAVWERERVVEKQAESHAALLAEKQRALEEARWGVVVCGESWDCRSGPFLREDIENDYVSGNEK